MIAELVRVKLISKKVFAICWSKFLFEILSPNQLLMPKTGPEWTGNGADIDRMWANKGPQKKFYRNKFQLNQVQEA